MQLTKQYGESKQRVKKAEDRLSIKKVATPVSRKGSYYFYIHMKPIYNFNNNCESNKCKLIVNIYG